MPDEPDNPTTDPANSNTAPVPPLELLLEDGPVLAVNKPAGWLTQGVPGGYATVESAVRDFLKQKYQKPGNVYLGLPHRLDRPVSGVLLFARNSKAAARLAEQFRERTVVKTYRALVTGRLEVAAGRLVDHLLKVPDEARTNVVPADTPGAKEARLSYCVLATHGDETLVGVTLETGRMHQIRAQFANVGCPVVGDTLYGGTHLPGTTLQDPIPQQQKNVSGSSQSISAESHTGERSPVEIRLHAYSLQLKHPVRYDEITVTAPLPESWPEWARRDRSQIDTM